MPDRAGWATAVHQHAERPLLLLPPCLQGRSYLCKKLDLDARVAVVRPAGGRGGRGGGGCTGQFQGTPRLAPHTERPRAGPPLPPTRPTPRLPPSSPSSNRPQVLHQVHRLHRRGSPGRPTLLCALGAAGRSSAAGGRPRRAVQPRDGDHALAGLPPHLARHRRGCVPLAGQPSGLSPPVPVCLLPRAAHHPPLVPSSVPFFLSSPPAVFDTVDLFLPDVQFETEAAHVRLPHAARQRLNAAGARWPRDGWDG